MEVTQGNEVLAIAELPSLCIFCLTIAGCPWINHLTSLTVASSLIKQMCKRPSFMGLLFLRLKVHFVWVCVLSNVL